MPLRRPVAGALALFAIAALPLSAQSAPSADTASADLPDADVLATGRLYLDWFWEGRADSLFAHAAPDVRGRVGSPTRFTDLRDQLVGQLGSETALMEEKVTRRRGKPQYWREASFANADGEPIVLRVVLDGERRLAGLSVSPKSSAPTD